jgi:glycosyltransferase involved in cell wall biosynthesis
MVKKVKGMKLILGSHGTDFIPGDRILARKVDASVSCSEYNSHLIYERYGLKPEVIYNGIDPRIFHPFRSSDSEVRQKYSISEDEKVIIYVGRLVGLKGVKILLRATALIPRLGIKLLIAGDGEERNSLAALAQSLGLERQVLFAGFVPNSELPRYYSIAQAAVFPTLADEAFGISICEAMACGLPVVASRVGGIPELVGDGDSGFLVQPGDPEELAEKIERLMLDDSLRRRMAARGAQVVQEQFTWEKVADRLLRVYRRVFP